MLMEVWPDFNPHKYLRNVYSSLLGKEEDYLHSIFNWGKKYLHNTFVGVQTTALQQQSWPLGQRLSGYICVMKIVYAFVGLLYIFQEDFGESFTDVISS